MSNAVASFWAGLSRGARLATAGAAVFGLALLVWMLFNVFHEEYRTLFADLSEGDTAAIVAQLKKDKVPYRLGDAGGTIRVPAEQVHDVRLALMAGDLPLSGGVGFEIFDKQGFGATEQSQRVSYQRALQGELARTIGTLEHVKHARVHLVMPESKLFTRDRQQASAAVALSMLPGASLQRPQIVGVQRLVAAAVPGLDPERVVITDQRGVTLSPPTLTVEGGAGPADARLQVKRDIEEYITHKVVKLLDSAFGPGRAIVSVDAALNFDATKTTIQDLLPANAAGGGEGRVVRRRQVTSASSTEPVWTSTADGVAPERPSNSSIDVEYQYGRRIDEVIAVPGALTRLSIGVIVPDDVTEEQRLKVADLVRMAAGIDARRGDAISVQPLSQSSVPVEADDVPQSGAAVSGVSTAGDAPRSWLGEHVGWIVSGAIIAFAAVFLLVATGPARRKRRSLSAQERERVLEDVRRILAEESSSTRRAVRT